MNRIELYQKTRKTLLDAYRNGELKHGDCTACAVGNICGGKETWKGAFLTDNVFGQDFYNPSEETIQFIESTGYSVVELAKIEFNFESSIFHNYSELAETKKGQYIGLQAVFKVLDEIHEVELPTSDEVQLELDSIAIGFGVKMEEV